MKYRFRTVPAAAVNTAYQKFLITDGVSEWANVGGFDFTFHPDGYARAGEIEKHYYP